MTETESSNIILEPIQNIHSKKSRFTPGVDARRLPRFIIPLLSGETSYSQRSPGGNQVDDLPPERHESGKFAFSRGQRLLIFLTLNISW